MDTIDLEITRNNTKYLITLDTKDYYKIISEQYRFEIIFNRSKTPYAGLRLNKNKTAHRIMLQRYVLNAPKGYVVDHINHNTLDNRKSNLRVTTHSENAQNRYTLNKNNKSGFRGVHWDTESKRWVVAFKLNNKHIHKGSFKNKDDAITASKKAIENMMPYASKGESN